MTLFLRTIESLLNLPFQLDEEARQQCAPLEGKVMRITLTQPSRSFDLRFHTDRLSVTVPEGLSDVTVRGSVSQFLALMRARPEQTQKVMASGLRIDGDVDTAFAAKRLFEKTSIDWEELLARAIGDVPSHLLSRAFRGLRDSLEYAAARLAANAVTFAQEEDRVLPRPGEVDALLQSIDALRDDAERLSQRIQRLKSRSC